LVEEWKAESDLRLEISERGIEKDAKPDRRNLHLFIDQAHNFATDSFAAFLAEPRKYRLCLALPRYPLTHYPAHSPP
jgi:hypothetical protein